MAFKQFLVASAIALACLVANASAFVAPMTTARAPATTSARSTASGEPSDTRDVVYAAIAVERPEDNRKRQGTRQGRSCDGCVARSLKPIVVYRREAPMILDEVCQRFTLTSCFFDVVRSC